MREKLLRKIIALMVAISLSVSGTTIVFAESILDTVDSTETSGVYAEDTKYSLSRGLNLNYGTASVAKISSMEVAVGGITQCHHECEKVYLELALERKVNGVYSTYKSWQFEDYNVSSLSRDIVVIVPSGYYYRVRGYHAAKDGVKEATSTLTQGILID